MAKHNPFWYRLKLRSRVVKELEIWAHARGLSIGIQNPGYMAEHKTVTLKGVLDGTEDNGNLYLYEDCRPEKSTSYFVIPKGDYVCFSRTEETAAPR